MKESLLYSSPSPKKNIVSRHNANNHKQFSSDLNLLYQFEVIICLIIPNDSSNFAFLMAETGAIEAGNGFRTVNVLNRVPGHIFIDYSNIDTFYLF